MTQHTTYESLTKEVHLAMQSRNYPEAVRVLESGRDRWGDSVEFIELLGQAYLANDEVEKAEATLLEAYEMKPSFLTMINLAECAFVRGDYLLAVEGFRTAYSAIPDNWGYGELVAFKVVVSSLLSGEDISGCEGFVADCGVMGKDFIEIVRAILAEESVRAMELLEKSETESMDAAPYIDALLTADLIQANE
ncbi:MAG: tetratricopeptide repeat protein [Akkermansiaceae bacterium]